MPHNASGAQFATGLKKKRIEVAFLRRLLTRAVKRFGFFGAPRELFTYVRNRRNILGDGPARFVEHKGEYWVVPDLPPLGSAQLLEYLLDDVVAVNTGARGNLMVGILSVASTCPHHCAYCYAHAGATESELPLPRLLETTGALLDAGVVTVHLSGGEPATRLPAVKEILRRFGERGRFWLLTTGYSMAPEDFQELAALGLTGVMVSMDSQSASHVEHVKGVPDAFEDAIAACRGAKDAGLLLAINSVVTRELLQEKEFRGFLTFTGLLGAAFVNCYPPKTPPGLRGAESSALDENPPFTVWEFERLNALCVASRGSRRWAKLPLAYTPDVWEAGRGCVGGEHLLYVDIDGDVRPCPFLTHSFGNITTDTLETIFTNVRENPHHERCGTNRLLTEHLFGDEAP
ncbi:radical SAM protein [Myxococcota bacterium]|nr:radical SAM protein [Myxococcota bacterium]MBU1535962.1 radical SAM protein [Myxococcota bacterium]